MFLHKHFVRDQGVAHEAGPEVSDILRNLSAMLSARRGSSSFHPSYGLAPTGYRSQQGIVIELGEQIRENVEAFERRLDVLSSEEVYDETTDQPAILVTCCVRRSQLRLYILANPRRTDISVGARPRGVL